VPELRDVDGGVELWVHVQPRASRDAVGGAHGGALRVKVRAPAEDGRANEAVCRALAEALGVRRAAVELVAGATARRKRVRIAGVARELRARVEALV
jgi:hypothetical protein